MKRILWSAGIFIFLSAFLWANASFGLQATSQLKHPGFSTVLEIIEVSPALISVSDQVTVSYYLTCSTIPSVSVIPVKVGLFFNTALARTETITNMPNGKRRRLFISGNAPATAGRTPW